MADHSDITNAEIDPDSPFTTSLAVKYRDNTIASKKIGIKSGDEAINNDNTLSEDADMTIEVTGGQVWAVEGRLYLTVAATNPSFQFSLVTPDPVNDTGIVFTNARIGAGGPTITAPAVNQDINAAVAYTVTALGNGEFAVYFSAQVTLDATPATGNIVVAWAQVASHAALLTMKENSYLVGYRADPT